MHRTGLKALSTTPLTTPILLSHHKIRTHITDSSSAVIPVFFLSYIIVKSEVKRNETSQVGTKAPDVFQLLDTMGSLFNDFPSSTLLPLASWHWLHIWCLFLPEELLLLISFPVTTLIFS